MVHVPLILFGILFLLLTQMGEASKIEWYVIQKVKAMRITAGFSQIALSQELEMTDSFVSHVETPKRRAKYNLNHLNALAKIFKCSPRDFLPEKVV